MACIINVHRAFNLVWLIVLQSQIDVLVLQVFFFVLVLPGAGLNIVLSQQGWEDITDEPVCE